MQGSPSLTHLFSVIPAKAGLGKIATGLEESPIPYTVDLSIWSKLDHTGLREHIEQVGVVFYQRANSG